MASINSHLVDVSNLNEALVRDAINRLKITINTRTTLKDTQLKGYTTRLEKVVSDNTERLKAAKKEYDDSLKSWCFSPRMAPTIVILKVMNLFFAVGAIWYDVSQNANSCGQKTPTSIYALATAAAVTGFEGAVSQWKAWKESSAKEKGENLRNEENQQANLLFGVLKALNDFEEKSTRATENEVEVEKSLKECISKYDKLQKSEPKDKRSLPPVGRLAGSFIGALPGSNRIKRTVTDLTTLSKAPTPTSSVVNKILENSAIDTKTVKSQNTFTFQSGTTVHNSVSDTKFLAQWEHLEKSLGIELDELLVGEEIIHKDGRTVRFQENEIDQKANHSVMIPPPSAATAAKGSAPKSALADRRRSEGDMLKQKKAISPINTNILGDTHEDRVNARTPSNSDLHSQPSTPSLKSSPNGSPKAKKKKKKKGSPKNGAIEISPITSTTTISTTSNVK